MCFLRVREPANSAEVIRFLTQKPPASFVQAARNLQRFRIHAGLRRHRSRGFVEDDQSAFAGEASLIHFWDAAYILVLSVSLLFWAKGTIRKRLSS